MNYISGANGFIGSKLLKRLGPKGQDGSTFDTITIPHDLISTSKLQNYDNFFFLSTYGNMSFHVDDKRTIQANLLDLIHILESSSLTFKSFVYISTSSVKLPVQTMYSRTKKAAEEVLLAYLEKYNLPICIIRPLSVTGVGEQKEHLIPKLINSCMTGEQMSFVPQPVHDYIDVDDLVDGIINLSFNGARGIFELGTGVQTSNQQVKELVEEVTGHKANTTEVLSMRKYDTLDWNSKNYKGRGWGWLPKKSLKMSITEMVEDFKANAAEKELY